MPRLPETVARELLMSFLILCVLFSCRCQEELGYDAMAENSQAHFSLLLQVHGVSGEGSAHPDTRSPGDRVPLCWGVSVSPRASQSR